MNFFKKIRLQTNPNTKSLLTVLILVNLLFLLVYEMFIKDILLNYFQNIQDIINKEYYSRIFSYLEYPLIFFTIVFSLLILFYSKINKILSKTKSEKSFLVFIIILNIVLQIIILSTVQTIPFADAKFYTDLGKRLYETGSYLNLKGMATSFWPVGLPAYLSVLMHLTNHFIIAAEIVNILISTLFILLLYFLFRKELSVKGRIIFLLVFTLFPNNLFSVNCILTDYPFAILLWLAVLIILKYGNDYRSIILSSIIVGLLSYLRASGLVIPLIILIYLLKKDKLKYAIRKGLVMMIVFCFMIAPWTYRNYKVFHKFIPISTNGGFNFLMGNHIGSKGNTNFNFYYDYSAPEPIASSEAYKQGINDIISNPMKSIIRMPQKIFFSYYREDSSITWSLKKTKTNISPLILSSVFFNKLFLLLNFSDLYFKLIDKAGKDKRQSVKIFYKFVIYFFYFDYSYLCRFGEILSTSHTCSHFSSREVFLINFYKKCK